MKSIRQLLALLLLLTYAVQSLAVVGPPCRMMGDMSGETMDMAGAEHAAHSASSETSAAESNCCEGDYCSMSQCYSSAALLQSIPSLASATRLGLHNLDSHSSPIDRSRSLFRPPISR